MKRIGASSLTRAATHGQHQTFWLAAAFSMLFGPANSWESALFERAASIREKIPGFPNREELYFPSVHVKGDGSGMRGFCNWIIPNRIMVGQYPGQSPADDGPSAEDVNKHLQSMVNDAGIGLFCSLQSEIPPQDDMEGWSEGTVYLKDARTRAQFPGPFTHYLPIVRSLSPDCQFLHNPIVDLSVPNSKALQDLLLKLLTTIDEEDRCVYIHCWGGRGRAGLVACCLLSLLFPDVDATAILDLVQAGYDSRVGAEDMPYGLSKSPQTDSQRDFVRQFVRERQKQAQ